MVKFTFATEEDGFDDHRSGHQEHHGHHRQGARQSRESRLPANFPRFGIHHPAQLPGHIAPGGRAEPLRGESAVVEDRLQEHRLQGHADDEDQPGQRQIAT